ncbi:hypothetical protein BofuT4_uP019900.1 [Botrytis cinerea T4]|uniref:Uncharacterized protein n=1 Tax=Botryotinia fuckeliana (strain T4) TaxID=999810 RepID=G2YIZ7_BOTF4|nr:hypothetical protein BofuT4_uP019900.1 [Botrytis cinerea T4]
MLLIQANLIFPQTVFFTRLARPIHLSETPLFPLSILCDANKIAPLNACHNAIASFGA